MHGRVFVPTKYEGYYWHTERHTLFSTKGKELRELKKHTFFSNTRQRLITGYSVYIKGGEIHGRFMRGRSVTVEVSELMKLNNEFTISLDKIVIFLPEELFVL